MGEITATELKQRSNGGEGIQCIDVRGPNECEAACLENSKLIPMGQVVSRTGEIDAGRATVVNCRGGVRGAKAMEALRRAGLQAASST